MSVTSAAESQFTEQLLAHQGILHKICFMFSGHGIECNDLKQEIIFQLWKSYPSFREASEFSTWMYRIALNTALSLTRRPSLFVDRAKAPEVPFDPGKEMDLSEDLKLLRKAIGYLSKLDRLIILLWLEERSYSEIADMVGVTEKNVSVRLVRIRSRLAEIMEKLK